ncbi:MAG: dihydroneopterin aldolase [Elusimicrobia bacterium]|nr:MAG: dihydroneopterin aldolase [Elusimicrobiota bacterium]
MKDRIDIAGISCSCHLGVPDEERKDLQTVLIDVEVETDLKDAGLSDDLETSVDYHGLSEVLRGLAEHGERKLLEKLAEDLAAQTLKFDKRISCVRIAAHKAPRVMPKIKFVTVRIERHR